jgi:hypothetical protein
MTKRIDIDECDLIRLFEAIRYVIVRYEKVDKTMVEFLSQELEEIESHFENEQRGDIIASEIDVVLGFIGGSDSNDDIIERRKDASMDLQERTSEQDSSSDRGMDGECSLGDGGVSGVSNEEAKVYNGIFHRVIGVFQGKKKIEK